MKTSFDGMNSISRPVFSASSFNFWSSSGKISLNASFSVSIESTSPPAAVSQSSQFSETSFCDKMRVCRISSSSLGTSAIFFNLWMIFISSAANLGSSPIIRRISCSMTRRRFTLLLRSSLFSASFSSSCSTFLIADFSPILVLTTKASTVSFSKAIQLSSEIDSWAGFISILVHVL